MISSILANQNRDPKKSGKPLTFLDFSFYKPRDGENSANYVYGSAMLKMAKERRLPPWALFCFKEVTQSASQSYKPEVCALVAEDALLLHPVKTSDGWEGMLIAVESASEKTRLFTDDNGRKYTLRVPYIHTKAICEEGVVLS